MAPGPPPRLASDPHVDPHVAEAIKQISAERVGLTIDKLVSFGNRSTISPQDQSAIQAGQGDTAPWNLAFPVAGAALLAALVLAGVRPRLAEYH